MKKLLISSLILMCFACGEKKKKQEVVTVENETHQQHPETITPAKRTAQIKDTAIAQIYDAYTELKNTLVNTDPEAAKTAGENFEKVAEAQNMSDQSLKEGLQAIRASDNIEKQREQLPAVTAAVKKLLDGEVSSGTLYYQYCPMAFNGKGAYWISNVKEIYNPYFGSKMMDCGAVEEEIK